jgi:hypothetical protein
VSDAAALQTLGRFNLLHASPVVLYAASWAVYEPVSALRAVLEAIPQRAVHLLVSNSWTLESPDSLRTYLSLLRRNTKQFEHVTLTPCCSNDGEASALRAEGFTPLVCHHNALIRHDFFTPIAGRQLVYDAIYDARWADYKRHHLAGSIRSLALIATPSKGDSTIAYYQKALAAVGHATWISGPWRSNYRWLSPQEVNTVYNQARVGLCLSSAEGGMYASIQYLLAGLPVVTTRSLGGRDEFFDPAFVRWVDDDADAVADAVAELISFDLDPAAIRDATIRKVGPHRHRLLEWMRRTIEAGGGEPGRWAQGWPEGLPHKLIDPMGRASDAIAEINRHELYGGSPERSGDDA